MKYYLGLSLLCLIFIGLWVFTLVRLAEAQAANEGLATDWLVKQDMLYMLFANDRIFVVGKNHKPSLLDVIRQAKPGDCIVSDWPVQLEGVSKLQPGEEAKIPDGVMLFVMDLTKGNLVEVPHAISFKREAK